MIRTVAAALCLLVAASATAQSPLPQEQWDDTTRLWLARAMVAEAGWEAPRDHVAIAYVITRRWKRAVQRWPQLTFLDMLRNYCAGLGTAGRELTPRQIWIRNLDELGPMSESEAPKGWPSSKARWSAHRDLWGQIVSRATAWGAGELPDPCRGRAEHWGGTTDLPKTRMVPVDCGDTENTFYELVPK